MYRRGNLCFGGSDSIDWIIPLSVCQRNRSFVVPSSCYSVAQSSPVQPRLFQMSRPDFDQTTTRSARAWIRPLIAQPHVPGSSRSSCHMQPYQSTWPPPASPPDLSPQREWRHDQSGRSPLGQGGLWCNLDLQDPDWILARQAHSVIDMILACTCRHAHTCMPVGICRDPHQDRVRHEIELLGEKSAGVQCSLASSQATLPPLGKTKKLHGTGSAFSPHLSGPSRLMT